MKRVHLLMFLLAFAFVGTLESFADSSPPGVEISINYELPTGVTILNLESQDAQVWQSNHLIDEGRIAVHDCDQKFWPENANTIYSYLAISNNITRINNSNKSTDMNFDDSLCHLDKNANRIQYWNSENENEVLSLFYTSNSERYSARNEVI